MYCAYLDDAGNTGENLSDPAQPIHYVGALLVPETEWAGVVADLRAVRKLARSFGYRAPQLEFHGTEVFQGRKGSGWDAVKFSDRITVYSACLDILESRNLVMFMGCCDKPKLKARYAHPEHPHALSMWLCLERVARHANCNNALTMMVADDCSNTTKQISRRVLADYRKRGAPFGMTLDFSNLIDTIHFMASSDSAHIQLCDMALFAIRRSESAPNDTRIKPLGDRALARVLDRRTIPY